MKSKKAQLDLEILEEPGFWILGGLAVGGTLIGFIWGRKMGWETLPIWQLIVILVGEIIAAAVFASRGN